MTKTRVLTIKNMLNKLKWDINIIHHGTVNSAHIISYNRVISLPMDKETDGFLIRLSPVTAPQRPTADYHIKIDMPDGLDFEFLHEGSCKQTRRCNRTVLWITNRIHKWQLTISNPANAESTKETGGHDVIVGDEISGREE